MLIEINYRNFFSYGLFFDYPPGHIAKIELIMQLIYKDLVMLQLHNNSIHNFQIN
jgi:hypothetical protein